MAVPNTYLMCAPSDVDNPFGAALTTVEIIRGLRRCNPRIFAKCNHVMQEAATHLLRVGVQGITSIWFDDPVRGAKKITALPVGVIPEFTQIGPTGMVEALGWRKIFEKVVKSKATTRRKIEREFKVVLDSDGSDGSCTGCRKEGKLSRAEHASGLCVDHESVRQIGLRGAEAKKLARKPKEFKEWLAST